MSQSDQVLLGSQQLDGEQMHSKGQILLQSGVPDTAEHTINNCVINTCDGTQANSSGGSTYEGR